MLHRGFGYLALALRGAFEVIGTLALFSQAGVILAIWLSITQELWIVAAAVALLRRKDVS